MIFSNKNDYKKKVIFDLLSGAEEGGSKLFAKSVNPGIKNVALFGSSSQVGLCVLQHLIALGIKTLVVYHNNKIDFTHPLLTFCHTSDLEKHKEELQNIIFISSINHLSSYRQFFSNSKKMVCFSSTSAVTKAKSDNVFEQEIVRSLLDGECNVKIMAKECKFDFVILRPTLIYGLGIDSNVTAIKRFIQRFKFFLVYPPANGKRQPVHADDLAMAAISCLNNPKIKNKIYDLPGGETLTYLQMVERVFQSLHRRPIIIKTKLLAWLMDLAGKFLSKPSLNGKIALRMNQDLVFDCSDASKDFGYKPRGFLGS